MLVDLLRSRQGRGSATGVAAVVVLTLVAWLLAPAPSGASAASNPPVTWDPPRLHVEVEPGGQVVTTVRVEVGEALRDARLWYSPSLEGAVSLPGMTVEEIAPASYELSVGLGAPADATVGSVVGGTLHLRSGQHTVARPLPVRISVVAPDPADSERRLLEPSADRVLDTPAGFVVRDEILVAIDPDDPDPVATARAVADRHGAELIGADRVTETFQLRVPAVDSLAALQPVWEQIDGDEDVEVAGPRVFAEVNQVRLPDDPLWDDWDESSPAGNNWHMEAIRAPSAWALETGSAAVTVGVIDADFEPEHEDLTFTSIQGERIGTGGHGTHVAGTVCADGDNAVGISGVSWECELRGYEIGARVLFATGAVDLAAAARWMIEAARDGARVVNMSFGFSPPCDLADDPEVQSAGDAWRRLFVRAISQAQLHSDVLWVAAAGNSDCDSSVYTPANLTQHFPTTFVSVAATNRDGDRSDFSNFGPTTTLAAPGGQRGFLGLFGSQNIFSTLPVSCRLIWWFCASRYGGMAGTSMAAPQVSGAGALMFSARPDLTAAQARQCLLSSTQQGRPVPDEVFGEINVAAAVECAQTIGDDPVIDLPPEVDIVFAVDLTGSMGGVVNTVKAEISHTLADLDTLAPDTDFRYALTSFEDYPGFYDSTPCGSSYQATYGGVDDEPFRLDQSLTGNAETVAGAVDAMQLGWGADAPESYGRVLWEAAQADTGDQLGWRADALKLLVMFGDDMPHSPDLHKGFPEEDVPSIPRDTGVDPGRSGTIDCNGDDIDFYDDALAALIDTETRLLFINNSPITAYQEAWRFWAAETGGAATEIRPDGVIDEGGLTRVLRDLIAAADT